MIEEGRVAETAIARLWPGEDERSCCSPGAFQRASQVAAFLGLPFHVLDRERDFAEHIVGPFVEGYVEGETPNPCVACNPRRLVALAQLADRRGLARVATGHYARLEWIGGQPFLRRAADRAKDQTYMLWAVPPDTLARLEFPLGDLTKDKVRAVAGNAGLPVATQPESQEVCFATDGYGGFLERHGVAPRPGSIVDRGGRVLGQHRGQWRFTIGQRRGLGVAAQRPLYVLERRAERNEVVVGDQRDLLVRSFTIRDVVDRGLGDGGGLSVQLRYRSGTVPVAGFVRDQPGELVVRLAEPFSGVAPGQSAVFYRDEILVGGGVLTSGPTAVGRV